MDGRQPKKMEVGNSEKLNITSQQTNFLWEMTKNGIIFLKSH
jgi:hypothetical protein